MAIIMKKTRVPMETVHAIPSSPGSPQLSEVHGMCERIARKAFELWDARGRREGYALQDWLDAEENVMDERHDTRV